MFILRWIGMGLAAIVGVFIAIVVVMFLIWGVGDTKSWLFNDGHHSATAQPTVVVLNSGKSPQPATNPCGAPNRATVTTAKGLKSFGQSATTDLPLQLHHGLDLHVYLNKVVHTGSDACFAVTLTSHRSSRVPQLDVQLSESYDGVAFNWAADVDQLNNVDHVVTNDGVKTMRFLYFGPGRSTSFDGFVKAHDPSENSLTNIGYTCIRLEVTAVYPGMPNAGWTDHSRSSCGYYG